MARTPDGSAGIAQPRRRDWRRPLVFVLGCTVLSCGRLGFDEVAETDSVTEAGTSDGSPSDGTARDAVIGEVETRNGATGDASQDTTVGDSAPPVDSASQDSALPDGAPPDTSPVVCNPSSVQSVPGTGTFQVIKNAAAMSQNITLTAGDLLVAVVYSGQGPGQGTPTTAPNMALSVSDSMGTVFYAAPMVEDSNHHQSAVQIFFAPNVRAGADAVTATSVAAPGSSLNLWTGLFLQEYSGLATDHVADVSTGQMAPTVTETVTPGSMTTRTGCDVVVGAFTDGYVDEQTLTSGMGWFLRSSDDWCPAAAVDDVATPATMSSVVNPVFNLSLAADNGWAAVQIALRGSTTTALPQPTALTVASGGTQTLPVGTCSSPVMLQTVAGGGVAPTGTGVPITLTATGLSLFADPLCKYPITGVAIGAGSSGASFYFTGSAPGSVTLVASAPGMGSTSTGETIQ